MSISSCLACGGGEGGFHHFLSVHRSRCRWSTHLTAWIIEAEILWPEILWPTKRRSVDSGLGRFPKVADVLNSNYTPERCDISLFIHISSLFLNVPSSENMLKLWFIAEAAEAYLWSRMQCLLLSRGFRWQHFTHFLFLPRTAPCSVSEQTKLSAG